MYNYTLLFGHVNLTADDNFSTYDGWKHRCLYLVIQSCQPIERTCEGSAVHTFVLILVILIVIIISSRQHKCDKTEKKHK